MNIPTEPLRILQVCADRGIAPGSTKGAAQHLRGIAAGLQRLGHSVVTYAQRKAEGDFPVEVRSLDHLASEARTCGAEVIYERYSLGHLAGMQLARDLDIPFVLEVNAPLVAEALAHRPGTVGSLDRACEPVLLEKADLVVTVSSALTRWVRSHRTGPTMTLTNGYEPSWFAEPEPEPTYPLVFLGHPKPWHGADRLPELLADLALRGLRPELLVIGGGPGAQDLIDHARALGVAEQITVTGGLPPTQATALLAKAAIGLAPYPRLDPFYFCPLKIVDYLAAGLAIVSTDQGDVPNLVGPAGLIVPADDPVAFANAVEELLVDPSLVTALGSQGVRRAAAELTWDHVAARTAEAIASLRSRRAVAV